MTPKEVLLAVRDLVQEPKTWTKGAWSKGKKYDLAGAFNAVIAEHGEEIGRAWWYCREAVTTAIGYQYGPYTLIEFNDAPDTTHDRVLSVIDFTLGHLE